MLISSSPAVALLTDCSTRINDTSYSSFFPSYSAGKSHCWLLGCMLIKRSVHNLFVYVCVGRAGTVQHQWLFHKDSSLSVLHMYRIPYLQNLMNSVIFSNFQMSTS